MLDESKESLPMSNIDEVTISLTDTIDDDMDEPSPPQPQPQPQPPKPIVNETSAPRPARETKTPASRSYIEDRSVTKRETPVPIITEKSSPKPVVKKTDHQSKETLKSGDDASSVRSDTASPRSSNMRPIEVPRSYETNGLKTTTQQHSTSHSHGKPSHTPTSSLGSSKDFQPNTTPTHPAGMSVPPTGTLSDLKRQRALQLQNALRARDPAFQSNTSLSDAHLGITGTLENSTDSIHSHQSNNLLPASEHNGHSPNQSRSNSTGPSPFIATVPIADPPKRRFTATSPSEIIGGDNEKQNCCIIL